MNFFRRKGRQVKRPRAHCWQCIHFEAERSVGHWIQRCTIGAEFGRCLQWAGCYTPKVDAHDCPSFKEV